VIASGLNVFKYLATWKLGDVFNAEGGAHLAVIVGVRSTWKKYVN